MSGRALRDEPRVDPRLLAAVEPFGLADPLPQSSVDASTPLDVIRKVLARLEGGAAHATKIATAGLEPIDGVERSTEEIPGRAGPVTVFVHRPAAGPGELPGVLHLHGGGGVMLSATDEHYVRWRDELALLGLVVVGVEFRNGAGRLGTHPFPAGLDDCASALEWMHSNRTGLRVGSLVVSGESGGGNLALATALRARRDGRLNAIDGVYAMCPYISNAYASPPAELPSLIENDGYLVSVALLGAMARAYAPEPEDAHDPLAWPYHATADDVAGLPPHVISVNQLDPLRDEGLAYYRLLVDAGVTARARVVEATLHAAENNYFAVVPDIARATLVDIADFARSLHSEGDT